MNSVGHGIDQYIKQRNRSAQTINDILPHRRFESSDAGRLVFSGLRKFEDGYAALFLKDDTMIVLPIDAQQHRAMQRMKIGSTLKLSSSGIIITKKHIR